MNQNYESIPKMLKDLNIWLCYDERDKDYFINLSDKEIEQEKKRPRDLKGKPHSLNSRLFSFSECLESINNGYNTGLGIVLKHNGLVVIDYDNCISGYRKDSKLGLKIPIIAKDRAEQIKRDIALIDSYTEISPSGKGIHIYLTANADIDINTNTDNIEIYTNKFIRVSGNLYNEFMYNTILDDKTAQLEQLLGYYGLNRAVISSKSVISKKDSIYKDFLEQKFKYNNTYTNKEILQTMFNSKNGVFLKQLYDNTISDIDYKQYKVDRLGALLKNKKITRDKYEYYYNKLDSSNSGKSFTLIINLLHFSYGDIGAVYDLFKSSALCKDDYLKKDYANGTKNIIQHHFIPQAIIEYINYTNYNE